MCLLSDISPTFYIGIFFFLCNASLNEGPYCESYKKKKKVVLTVIYDKLLSRPLHVLKQFVECFLRG